MKKFGFFVKFGRFDMVFDFLETLGSSRSVRCQSFSSVRRLEAEKTPKKQYEKILIFGQVRFGRFDNPFDSIDNVLMGVVDRPVNGRYFL